MCDLSPATDSGVARLEAEVEGLINVREKLVPELDLRVGFRLPNKALEQGAA